MHPKLVAGGTFDNLPREHALSKHEVRVAEDDGEGIVAFKKGVV